MRIASNLKRDLPHPQFEKFLNVLQTTLAYNLLPTIALHTWPGYDVQYIISEPYVKAWKRIKYPRKRALLDHPIISQLINKFTALINSAQILLPSQEFYTGTYLEASQLSTHLHYIYIYFFLKIHFSIIPTSICTYVSKWFSPFTFSK
jgi:hypothetical protein